MTEPLGQRIFEAAIDSYEDIILARQKVGEIAAGMGFSLLNQTRIVTAVSELARNIVVHARSGRMIVVKAVGRTGITIRFEDEGPGIADIGRALEAGYSTANSLGLGLQGAKRLTDKMEIASSPGKGTTVVVTKWL